jgi:hypothetical protein
MPPLMAGGVQALPDAGGESGQEKASPSDSSPLLPPHAVTTSSPQHNRAMMRFMHTA